jgi:DNA-binding CsgD family transcriptional regulator
MRKERKILLAIRKIKSLQDMESYFHNVANALNVVHISFSVIRPICRDTNEILNISTYDKRWTTRYHEKGYCNLDPTIKQGASAFLPLDWSTFDRSRRAIDKFFKEAETCGVGKRGLTIPVRGFPGEISLLSVTSNEPSDAWHKRRPSLVGDLYLIASSIHDVTMKLAKLRRERMDLAMSLREQQVFELLARGQSPTQIAFDLNITLKSVRELVRSGRHRISASNKYQAIALAVYHDLIHL